MWMFLLGSYCTGAAYTAAICLFFEALSGRVRIRAIICYSVLWFITIPYYTMKRV